MRGRDVRRSRLFSVESVAGWVFADLLLVLFLVGLGSAIPAEPEPEPEPKAHKTEKPPKKPDPPIVGMQTIPVVATVRHDPRAVANGGPRSAAARVLCSKVRREMEALKGERAALVLLFGGAPDVVQGQDSARAVARQLECAAPHVFTARTPTRPFWDGGLPLGQVRLEVFLFTTEPVQEGRS